jgi:tetratricopeptide (TPR) repeat protein
MDRFPTPVDRGRGWPRGKGVGRRSWACDPALLRSHRDARRGLERFAAAIALAPTLAEAHLARAIHLHLDPGLARTREWMVSLHIVMGRPREALAEARRALAIGPLSASANAELARALLVNGRCDEAMERLEPLVLLDPPVFRVPSLVAQCHAHEEKRPEAIAALRRASDRLGPRGDGLLGFMMARGGEWENATLLLEKPREEWEQGALPVALVHAGLGDSGGGLCVAPPGRGRPLPEPGPPGTPSSCSLCWRISDRTRGSMDCGRGSGYQCPDRPPPPPSPHFSDGGDPPPPPGCARLRSP